MSGVTTRSIGHRSAFTSGHGGDDHRVRPIVADHRAIQAPVRRFGHHPPPRPVGVQVRDHDARRAVIARPAEPCALRHGEPVLRPQRRVGGHAELDQREGAPGDVEDALRDRRSLPGGVPRSQPSTMSWSSRIIRLGIRASMAATSGDPNAQAWVAK